VKRLENYFNYFTEIEEHFQRRRGGGLLLSTLDWALIETWKDAGIPLEAALRGIDAAFDKYDARPSKTRKVNSLAYCAQEVLAAAEEMKEAVVGVAKEETKSDSGFRAEEIAAFLRRNADALDAAKLPEKTGISANAVAKEAAGVLREHASKIESAKSVGRLEDLERHLTLLEERLFVILLAASPDEQVLAARAEADRELAPYRRKVPAQQVEQLQKQFVHKRLLEKFNLPRLSLFYM
jgi:hypothetical protein